MVVSALHELHVHGTRPYLGTAHANAHVQLYENKHERVVDPPLREMFILFLGYNNFYMSLEFS